MKPPLQRIEEFLEPQDTHSLSITGKVGHYYERCERLEAALKEAVDMLQFIQKMETYKFALKNVADILDGGADENA